MKVFRKVNGIFAQKNDQNTKFTTNDRTRNTKFILDHVFKWKSRKMVISGCKMGPKRCTRRKFPENVNPYMR